MSEPLTPETRAEWREGDWVEYALDPRAAHARILALLDALDKAERERDAIRDERNHWIGEAKRYERLYRSRDEDAIRWFGQRNEAREALAHRERMENINAAEVVRLREALAEVLATFTEKGHPGRACLRSGWQYVETVARWSAALTGTDPTDAEVTP